MIQIRKGEIPLVLRKKGKKLIDEMKVSFNNGQRTFKFDSTVWKAVKLDLIKIQHNKCCFCESSLHSQHADVEHFRPKGAWKQSNEDKLSDFGYYWFAYDWDNLFLACQVCNQIFKKNFFPLEEPANRAFNHTYNISNEAPLIINPSTDIPEEHLFFKKEIATGKSNKGLETIKRTAISEQAFQEDRKVRLEAIEALIKCLKLFNNRQLKTPNGIEITNSIKNIVNKKKPYYAMLRDNFQQELQKYGIEI